MKLINADSLLEWFPVGSHLTREALVTAIGLEKAVACGGCRHYELVPDKRQNATRDARDCEHDPLMSVDGGPPPADFGCVHFEPRP